MRRLLAVLLVMVLVLGVVTPAAMASQATPGMPAPMLDVPVPEGVPAPGELLRTVENPISTTRGMGWNAARIEVGNITGSFARFDVVLIGAVENHGIALLTYDCGTTIQATRRVFRDGEVITFMMDPTIRSGRAELYVPFREVYGTHGVVKTFFDARGFASANSSADHLRASPYTSVRPIGPDSIHDILYTDSNNVTRITQTFLSDTQPSQWAVGQVNAAITAGLVPPHLQSRYTQATTRAEFAALAVALYENQRGEITGRVTFTDTDNVDVQKAAYIGVVQGVGNNRFAPNDTLTREQAAVMLARLANALDRPLSAQAPTFADNGSIASWAFDHVGQVQAAGIMHGVGNNRFDPQGSYTREQSIVTIYRLFGMVR